MERVEVISKDYKSAIDLINKFVKRDLVKTEKANNEDCFRGSVYITEYFSTHSFLMVFTNAKVMIVDTEELENLFNGSTEIVIFYLNEETGVSCPNTVLLGQFIDVYFYVDDVLCRFGKQVEGSILDRMEKFSKIEMKTTNIVQKQYYEKNYLYNYIYYVKPKCSALSVVSEDKKYVYTIPRTSTSKKNSSFKIKKEMRRNVEKEEGEEKEKSVAKKTFSVKKHFKYPEIYNLFDKVTNAIIGPMLIPTIECSVWMNDITREMTKDDTIDMVCSFEQLRGKWKPICIA